MKLKDMKKEELEALSYTDLTEIILKEKKKSMNTASIFKKICELLELSDEEYASKIGDYYTSLTTDKRFILLDSAEWDLRDNHKVEIVMDEDEDDDEVFDEETEDDEEVEDKEDFSESVEVTDDEVDLDDDMDDLNIVDEDELEEDI